MATGDTAPSVAKSTWDRRSEQWERWAPYLMLAISAVISAIQPGQTIGDRLAVLGLVALAAAWIGGMHIWAPARRRARPVHSAVYFVGVLILAWLLMQQDVVFFIFAIIGFLHAAHLRPRLLVFGGVGATSFIILLVTWGGFPQSTPEETGGFVTLLVLQTLLIGYGLLGAERLVELGEQRRRTVEQLEATLAENEGLHAQLLAQAHEAGIHDERQRMAREIHDTLAQGLTGVITQLEAADQSRHDPSMLRRHLDAATTLARESLSEARRSVQALGPGALERGRLAGALDKLVREWSERSGVPSELSTSEVPDALPADAEVALLRVGQEALANVAKHASAGRVGVTLSGLGDAVALDVRDDGRGFDAGQANGGYGLETMRQRVEAVRGSLAVESTPGFGTAVSATVPLSRSEPPGG